MCMCVYVCVGGVRVCVCVCVCVYVGGGGVMVSSDYVHLWDTLTGHHQTFWEAYRQSKIVHKWRKVQFM